MLAGRRRIITAIRIHGAVTTLARLVHLLPSIPNSVAGHAGSAWISRRTEKRDFLSGAVLFEKAAPSFFGGGWNSDEDQILHFRSQKRLQQAWGS